MNWDKCPGKFPQANYEINVGLTYLEAWIQEQESTGIELDPDFQRAHVWTREQQVAYLEYLLRGGEGSRIIYWNAPGWPCNIEQPIVLVDGKQRLQAARIFMRGDLKVFGARYHPEDRNTLCLKGLVFRIAALSTRADVLRWYLAINAGGTPHTKHELDSVSALLAVEEGKVD